MKDTIHYTSCPVCGGHSIIHVLDALDHTVSRQRFEIWECSDCSLRFTQDAPDQHAIRPYYKSENYISHTNTSKGLINNLYHRIRKITLSRKRRMIASVTGLKTGSLLDLGAGTGAFAAEMKSAGWQVTALEPDPEARELGAREYGIRMSEVEELFYLPDSYQAITMWHVLEHVHDLHRTVQQLGELLAPGGCILIAVPNYTAADARIYQGAWAAYDVPRHLYHFSPRSMEVLMKRHGLKLIGHKPMWYDSFYISLLSSRIRDGKTGWVGAILSGLRSNLAALGNVRKCSSVIYVIGK